MYPTNPIPTIMPLTGAGGLAMVSEATNQPNLLLVAVAVLALWTIIMAVLSLKSIAPRREL